MALDVDELLDQVDADLGLAVTPSLQNSRALDDLYEAFLFGLLLRAARLIDPGAMGWENLTGVDKDEVRLRAGPGEIYSTGFSFATLTFGGDLVFEVHQGVRAVGLSQVAHECDIAAIHAGRGAWRRARRERPGPIDLFLAIEAKAYEATSIGLGIGRGVIGLRAELQQPRVALVASGPIDVSVKAAVASWAFGAFPDVMPRSAQADQLVGAMQQLLES